jgi:HPt (histidine-containing phosphotransfer) domain-containing protein
MNEKLLKTFLQDGMTFGERIRQTLADGNVKDYTIAVHALKSALANVGAIHVSGFAAELEDAGHKENISYMEQSTPRFLRDLEKVLDRIRALYPEEDDDNEVSDNAEVLNDKLNLIIKAMGSFDTDILDKTLRELQALNWSRKVKAGVESIARMVLRGDFDEAEAKAMELKPSVVVREREN